MSEHDVRDLLRRSITPELYDQIRAEWKRHSIAEDQRDLDGLISTLTEDCVYEVVTTGHKWRGHDGARQFYTQLLTAFPDIHFDLQYIVIGPQGVHEEAAVTGTHEQDWLEFTATGRPVAFNVQIFFPWDLKRGKFLGERVHFDARAIRAG